jgi:hypothetical protein
VRTIDEEFRALVAVPADDEPGAEQLRSAARALTDLPPALATSITCVPSIPEEKRGRLSGLARRIAAAHGLAVEVSIEPFGVRFSRRTDL